MPGAPLLYTPPAYTATNVVYGLGVMLYAPPQSTVLGAAVPADVNLGVYSSWSGLGWSYIGAVLDGVTLTYAPTTQDITIEEQPTPVGVAVSTANLTLTANMSEETMQNVNLAWGNSGTIATTSAGPGQPGKYVLTLSTTFQQVSVAVIGKNAYGFASVLYVPFMLSAGQVQTAYRRAAQQRIYPLTFNSVCAFNQITWTELYQVATS
jgi:hypothetical protein